MGIEYKQPANSINIAGDKINLLLDGHGYDVPNINFLHQKLIEKAKLTSKRQVLIISVERNNLVAGAAAPYIRGIVEKHGFGAEFEYF